MEVVNVFDRKIWIESDSFGSKHVMIQHDDGESEPFQYCSFYYDYGHTSNSVTLESAKRIALSLGAVEPVEVRHRPYETR